MLAEPNLILDALIEAAGLSHSGMATRINMAGRHLGLRYDHASVARWIRDGAVPRHPVPDLICEILGSRLRRNLLLADIGMVRQPCGSSETTLSNVVDQAKALWRAEYRGRGVHDGRRPLSGANAVAPLFEWENPPPDFDVSNSGPSRVGQLELEAVQLARTHYVQMYRRVGGVPVRARLVAYLATKVTPMLSRSYTDTTGRELFRAVGGLVAFAAVCAYDAEKQGLAQRYFFHALRMAKASGDKAFGCYVVALLANQAIYLKNFRLAIQYAETALRAGHGALSPALKTDLHSMQAKSYARLGDAECCRRHMKAAEVAAARIVLDNEPPEISYVQPGLMEVQHAEALRRIGDLRAAQTYAEQAVTTARAAHARGQVHRLAALSLVLTERKQVEQGLIVAEQAFTCASGMESWRIRDRLRTVVDRLRTYADLHDVAAFLDRARIALAAPL